MAIDLNMDVSQLLKGLFQSFRKGADGGAPAGVGQHSKALVTGFLGLVLLAAYVALVAWPTQTQNTELESRANALKALQQELTLLQASKKKLDQEVGQEMNKNKKLMARFVETQEIEAFYDKLSQLAAEYGLEVVLLKRGQELPVHNPDQRVIHDAASLAGAGQPANPEDRQPPIIYKSTFELSLMGGYLPFLNFMRDLGEQEELVQLDKATISLIPNDPSGQVKINLSLSSIRLPAPPLQRGATPLTQRTNQGFPDAGWNFQKHALGHGIKVAKLFHFINDAAAEPLNLPAPAPKAATPPTAEPKTSLREALRDPFSRDLPPTSPNSPAATAPPQPQDSVIVFGIMIGPNSKAALVQIGQSDPQVVKVGSHLRALEATVSDITQDGIKLKKGGDHIRIPMQDVPAAMTIKKETDKKEAANGAAPQ